MRRQNLSASLIGAALSLLASTVWAQPLLYDLDDNPLLPKADGSAPDGAVSEYRLTVRPEILAANPESLLLELPEGRRLEAVRSRFVDYGPEWKSWTGKLRPVGLKGPGTGHVYLGFHGHRITGKLRYEGERYLITGGISAPQRLVRRLEGLTREPHCALSDHALAESSARPLGPVNREAVSKLPAVTAKTQVRLDLMVLYPKVFFSSLAEEVAIQDFVEDSIDEANMIFDNSNVNARYNLVHVGPIVNQQPAANSLQSALDLLNSQPYEIQVLRWAYGADFIAMIVPFSWTGSTGCGTANLPVERWPTNQLDYVAGFNLQGAPLGNRAYATFRQDCAFDDYTLAHELGHTLGMWHDNVVSSGPWRTLEADALGYTFTLSGDPAATVMGCNCGAGGCGTAGMAAICNREPYFSDPSIFIGSEAVGRSSPNPTRNADMARDNVSTYGAFRGQKTINPPTAAVTASCSGRTCTFNASGSSDENGLLSFHWDFGDGTSATTGGAVVSHTYGGSQNVFHLHLLVTDKSRQRTLKILKVLLF